MTKNILILLIFLSTISFSQAPTNGLVASYSFNGNANDESGNGNNGSVNGATLTTDRFGKANSAYSFDGLSNSISLPLNLSGSLINSKKLTISAFVNTNSTIGGGIFSNWKAFPLTDPFGILFSIGDGMKLTATTNSGTGVTTKTSIAPNQWVHVLAVFDSDMKNALNRMKLYINGVNAVADSGVLAYSNRVIADNLGNTATNTEIGRWKSQFNWSGYFKGSLDDIKIYNRALSASEITALYNENTCFKTVSVTDTLRISSIAGINSLPESFGSIKVYPNPAHDILNISISKPSTDYSIKIADNMGKTVYTSAMTSNNLQINLSQFTAKGLYLIQILDNTNKVLDVRKLVLE